jgi:UDP:flavonoid glycosyltransferase YjiC (YdhE family)
MRIVVSGEGTRGDLYPLLALGEALREAGHSVSVCAPSNFEHEVTSRGFPFASSGLDIREYVGRHARDLTRGGLGMARAQRVYLDTLLKQGFEALHAATEGADLLIGGGVCLAGATIAAQRSIPYRYLAYCPPLLPSDEHTPVFLASRHRWPVWLNRLAWRWLIPLVFWPVVRAVNERRRAVGIAPERDAFRLTLGEAPVLLATDAELAPPPRDCRLEVRSIGALQTDVEGPLPEKLERFLDAGPPPVYFGFGSMPDEDPERTTRMLIAASERAGCRALISAGWAGLGESALPESVFALGPASHARLFPRVAAVVHHGGAGTTTTAARAGVPQVVVPHLLDQHYWAERVLQLGVAPPPLQRRRLGVGGLGDALRAVLDNEWIQRRAAELGERLRRGDPLSPEQRSTLVERVLA